MGSENRKSAIEKWNKFLKGLGDSLELSWKPSWTSWACLGKPDVPEYLQKTYQKTPFRNRFFSL
jgi:hypothetical protein